LSISVGQDLVPERFRALAEATAGLGERFAQAGKHIYLVGGSVRDCFLAKKSLGKEPVGEVAQRSLSMPKDSAVKEGEFSADLDLTTDALPEEVEQILFGWAEAIWPQGKAFGTIGALHNGLRYEITTHRREVYVSDSRKPQVVYGTSIEEDLARRDFTVNAMALELPGLKLLDPFGGLQDLASKLLRTPREPEVALAEDPLRMLRAARFASALDMEVDPELVAAMAKEARRLSIVSPERIHGELDKLLVTERPSKGLTLLVNTKVADRFLPELSALQDLSDPLHRHKDVFAHTLAVIEQTPPERLVRLAALFHDVGKPSTRQFASDGVSFHNHDLLGARITRRRMRALHYSNEDIEVVSRLVELHLRFHTYRLGWTDKAVRRYVRDAGDLLERLNLLVRADCTTRNAAKARALQRRMDELEARIEELARQEELSSLRPELNGTEVMEILSITPGPLVGRALDYLMEIRLDEGLIGREEAIKRLQNWYRSQGQSSPPAPSPPRRGTERGETS
jgi:poly(A) polymerase